MSSSGRRYRFGELLGEGGFGVVYRAAMLGADGFEKPVAIKLLRLAGGDVRFAQEAQQRFRDEARLLGLLRHRAIVQVDSLVHIGGHQAVVMELLEGVSLRALVKLGPVPEGPALEMVAEVAAALEAAWHRPGPEGKPLNVCHRDLKPANLQLSPDGELKVLDFGIARADFQAREAATRSLAMGSVEYMSPLRLDFDDDGTAGDIYSLGCVLYELLVGEAFGRTSANPVSHKQRFEANIERVPESARPLVGRMLAFAGADRPRAREVEKRCLELSRSVPLRLRDWAADAVPAALAVSRPVSGSWSGKLLAEDGDAFSPPTPARSNFVIGISTGVAPTVSAGRVGSAVPAEISAPRGKLDPLGPITAATRSDASLRRSPLSGPVSGMSGARKRAGAETATKAGAAALGVMGFSSITVGCVLAVVAIWFAVKEFKQTAQAEVPEVPPIDAPAPSDVPVAAVVPVARPAPVATDPLAVPAVPSVVVPAEPAHPAAAKKPVKSVEPAELAPASDPGISATIELSGNAEAVRLRRADTIYALPMVPAGTYTVLATFDGKEVDAGSVSVAEAEKVVLKCKKAFLRCTR